LSRILSCTLSCNSRVSPGALQAVAWAMPILAELLLVGLMGGPHSKSFEELANGACGAAGARGAVRLAALPVPAALPVWVPLWMPVWAPVWVHVWVHVWVSVRVPLWVSVWVPVWVPLWSTVWAPRGVPVWVPVWVPCTTAARQRPPGGAGQLRMSAWCAGPRTVQRDVRLVRLVVGDPRVAPKEGGT